MPITGPRTTAAAAWHELTARLAQPRRVAVAVLVAIAAVCGLDAARPAAARTHDVWVAARDLPGGQPIRAADVHLESLPAAAVPTGALPATTSPSGHLLAAPVRRGEPLTDVRLLSPSLLTTVGPPSARAVTVRVADGSAATALVDVGDMVDVIAAVDPAAGADGATATVARGVRVLAIPGHPAGSESSDGDGLLVVAATPRQAAALAAAAASSRLSVAVRPPG